MKDKTQKALNMLNLVFLIAPRIILLLIILGIAILTMAISIFFQDCANKLFPKELRTNKYKYIDELDDILSTWFD